MTDYLAKLIRKRYPTGKELGVIAVSNWALFLATETLAIDTDKLQQKLNRIADNEAQLRDFNVYADIQRWIETNRSDAETNFQECLMCIRQITTMINEAYAVEIMRDFGCAKLESHEIIKAHNDTLHRVTQLLTPLERLNTDGMWGDGKYHVVSAKEYMLRLYNSRQVITAYNFVILNIAKFWNLPDVRCLTIDTEELDDLIQEYLDLRDEFIRYCETHFFDNRLGNYGRADFTKLDKLKADSLYKERVRLASSYVPNYRQYSIPVEKRTQFTSKILDTTQGIFNKPIETVIADLTEE